MPTIISFMTPKIVVETKKFPGEGEVFIYIVFENTFKNEEYLQILDKKTDNKLVNKFKIYDFKGKEDEILTLELNGFYKEIIVVGAGKSGELTLAKWKKLMASAFRVVQSMKYQSATTCYFPELGKDFFEIGKNLSLALNLSNYQFDFYKSEEEKKKIKKIEQLNFQFSSTNFQSIPIKSGSNYKSQFSNGIEYGKLLSGGIYLTRDLVNQPASHTHPETLEKEAFQIEKESKGKIKVEVLDEDECQRLGMGAFLGVAQGSERKPKFIILHYSVGPVAAVLPASAPPVNSGDARYREPSRRATHNVKICLIGKSITFDSGGLSLKPSESMETMKMDMAGGATVLGIFKILSHLDVDGEIYGILPACENMPSGKALKPGDIVTALNKKTIEVLNTDAEGRVALADALAYAEKNIKPDIIVDLATLTGACMVALGKSITGMFGNNEPFMAELEKIAKEEGEELWHMPLYKPYAKKMKSDVADLKNIGGGRYGGAITAALFLSEFVKKSKWVHFDIAGPAFNDEGPTGVITRGGTGWGVVTIMEFLKKLEIRD